jgi:hypothetical protein
MDLIELIENKRFLGSEFLTWFWFESEVFEGTLSATDEGTFGLWLEGQITLEGLLESKEQSKLRGVAPASTPEAREALRQGKLPTQAKVRLERNEQGFGFVFQAESLGLTGVKIPQTLKEEKDEDEAFYDRMARIEELEAIVGALYKDFIALRLTAAWDSHVLPAMRAWVAGEKVDADAYRRGKPKKRKT